jgi:hypothetical protein
MSESDLENGRQPTSLRKKIVGLILGIGAVSGALLSAYSLYVKFNPPPPPPHAQAKGEISDVAFENTKGGIKVRWKATVEGYKGKAIIIRWTLYDAEVRAPVSNTNFRHEYGAKFTPSFDVDQGSDSFFVPAPKDEGTYYVRIELDPPSAATLDSEESKLFDWTSGQNPGNEETTQTSDSTASAPASAPSGEDIQNLDTPPSEATEGVVVVSPDFNVEAATAEEAAAINAAIEYYQYAETGVYYTTYNLLSSEAQAYYTQDEWVAANTALDSAAGEFVVTDAYSADVGLGVPTYAVTLTVYADSSSFNRTTYFIYENGHWAHHLSSEEQNMFDDALY